MNARQANKYLKEKINKLKSDNRLMHRIIADSPNMQELYELYNKPLNVTHTVMHFQQFKMQRLIPDYETINGDILIDYEKHEIAQALFEGIKDYITYEFETKYGMQAITGSIYIGRK